MSYEDAKQAVLDSYDDETIEKNGLEEMIEEMMQL
ncbi:hypothetical protein SEA_DUMPTRUCK_78 [Gordonia phage DumpTruck]|nr:hypothetical protein SEA_DUMPTRUCK_78 [Gordonia phage DumpTruck]